jgi:1,4-alpha-glucan branching enzyme
LKEYHIDGLAFSCVDSLSLNVEDQELLERFTSYLKKEFPDVILIGEKNIGDCSGFDFKWDRARKNDVVLYSQEDPFFRKFHHEKLTYFSTCSLGEKYIFPITCAEDSDKESFINNISGDYWQKFASARALLGYMMTVSGKKHTFMGTEIGQFCNWDRNGELDWFLLEYESHAKLQLYISKLNNFYLESKALWGTDNSEQSFKWIDANNRNQNIISYRRIDSKGNELMVIINFSPVVHESYQLGVTKMGEYIEVFNSDEIRFGGSGVINSEMLRADKSPYNYLPYSVSLRIPPLGMVILKHK